MSVAVATLAVVSVGAFMARQNNGGRVDTSATTAEFVTGNQARDDTKSASTPTSIDTMPLGEIDPSTALVGTTAPRPARDLVWEITGTEDIRLYEEVKISGDRAYSIDEFGWLSSTSDFVTWTQLSTPPELATDGGGPGINIEAFAVTGDVVVAVATDIEFDADNSADEPPSSEWCSNPAAINSGTALLMSGDRGETWQVTPFVDPNISGRFAGSSSISNVASDGSSALLLVETYLELDVWCVLAEAGVDMDAASAGVIEQDSDGITVAADDDVTPEVTRYRWTDLGLNDAEMAATNAEAEFSSSLMRLGTEAGLAIVDLGLISDVVGIPGEYLANSRKPEALHRSTDGGLTWTATSGDTFAISASSSTVLANWEQEDRRFSLDGGRSWVGVGSPPGVNVHQVEILDGIAAAIGERDSDDGSESVLSIRSTDGIWTTSGLPAIAPGTGWASGLTALGDAFYLAIEPRHTFVGSDGDDGEAVAVDFDMPITIVGRFT